MYRYLKSNSHVTLVFQAEKNSNKSRSMGSGLQDLLQAIKETVCSYCLSGKAGREIFSSWWQLTDFAALGPHGMTRRAKYFPVWPDLASRYTFKRKTAVFLVLPFFWHIFILTSRGDIRWAVRLFPTLLVPLRTFLIPGFFHKNQDQ